MTTCAATYGLQIDVMFSQYGNCCGACRPCRLQVETVCVPCSLHACSSEVSNNTHLVPHWLNDMGVLSARLNGNHGHVNNHSTL